MPKKRVHEIAKEHGLTSKEVLAAFKDAGVYVKAASSTVEERDIRRAFPNGPVKVAEPEPAKDVDEAPAAKEAADRDADGRAKVPRAKATKRTKEEAAAAAAAKAEAAAAAKPKPRPARPEPEAPPAEGEAGA